VKDNISLIAAATGGFMLSIALSGLLQGAPITAGHKSVSFHSVRVTDNQCRPSPKIHFDIFPSG
jgi:hypothetical protein